MRARLSSLSFISRLSLFAVCAAMIVLVLRLTSDSELIRRAGAQTSKADTAGSNAAPTEDTSQAGCCGDDENNKPHLLAGSYYSVRNSLSAKLLLNNKGPQPIVVMPTLFSLSGERFDVTPVTVDPNNFRMIDLRDWVATAGPNFEEGSIQIFHRGKDLVLGAQMYLTDEQHSLSFEEKLNEPANSPSAKLEGLWWLASRKGSVMLVLSNTTEQSLSVTVSVEGRKPRVTAVKTLELLTHETRVLDMQKEILDNQGKPTPEVGGISIYHSGPNGAVVARAMAQDAAIGYSLPVQFTDPKTAKSSRIQAAGLRLGNVADEQLTPVVVARNISNEPTVLTGRMPFSTSNGSTGVVDIPKLRLAAGEIAFVDLERAIKKGDVQQDVAAAGLEFEYTSDPGSVILLALSVSNSGNQVFRPPLWDIKAQNIGLHLLTTQAADLTQLAS